MAYFVRTPGWLKACYPKRVWDMPADTGSVYLTFDDGPHPEATPFVLDLLDQYQAKASFFCIGKNVNAHPDIYQRILQSGHATGNHTQHHVNGWKTKTELYLQDVQLASNHIQSVLFRPPYGRLKSAQARAVKKQLGPQTKIVMWSVLSGDFDTTLTPEKCIRNVIDHTQAGSIIVFHDSAKAFPVLKKALPGIMKFLKEKGLQFKRLEGE